MGAKEVGWQGRKRLKSVTLMKNLLNITFEISICRPQFRNQISSSLRHFMVKVLLAKAKEWKKIIGDVREIYRSKKKVHISWPRGDKKESCMRIKMLIIPLHNFYRSHFVVICLLYLVVFPFMLSSWEKLLHFSKKREDKMLTSKQQGVDFH